MAQITIDPQLLATLQHQAEAIVRGEPVDLAAEPSGIAAIDALQRAIMVLGAHTSEGLRQQHAYIAALSSAQEAERGRLARELHDEVVQQLIALMQATDRVQRLLERDPTQAAERLRGMRASLAELVDALRLMIGDLRPPALAELGLLPAVELLLQRRPDAAPELRLATQGQPRRLAPQSELALFRIVQEAWNNVLRHAQAQHVEIIFSYAPDGLLLTISDDGVGFVLLEADAAPAGHWGLRGMRERAELVGGTLTLHSQPGQGTQLIVHVPYPGSADRDLVCGMPVGPAALGAEHDGLLYRFCSPACRDLFQAQPDQYIARPLV